MVTIKPDLPMVDSTCSLPTWSCSNLPRLHSPCHCTDGHAVPTLPCIAEQRPTHDVQFPQVQRPTCVKQEAEYEWLVPAKGLPASLTELRLLHWPRITARNDMSGGRFGLHQDRPQHCHLAQFRIGRQCSSSATGCMTLLRPPLEADSQHCRIIHRKCGAAGCSEAHVCILLCAAVWKGFVGT